MASDSCSELPPSMFDLDVEDQLLHRRLFVADADDLERLHQRDAGREHGRELAAEDRDVHRA